MTSTFFFLSICAFVTLFSPKNLVYASKERFVFPAEFQCEHEAIWLAYATKGLEEFKKGLSVKNVQLEIAKQLTPTVKVKFIVNNENEQEELISMIHKWEIQMDRIEIYIINHIDVWMRDFGPIFLLSTHLPLNDPKRKRLSLFDFNSYGLDLNKQTEYSQVNSQLGTHIAHLLNIDIIKSNPYVVSEGGGRSVNGAGVLLVTSAVEVQRNSHKKKIGKSELEEAYKNALGVEKVIWLSEGVMEDQISNKRVYNGKEYVYTCMATNGHVDEYVRFINETHVLMNSIDDSECIESDDLLIKSNCERLKKAKKIIENETDLQGKKLHVIDLPSPDLNYEIINTDDELYKDLSIIHYEDNSTFPYGQPIKVILPHSYMNFLITNEVILIPQYYIEGKSSKSVKEKDKKVRFIMQQIFPEKKIKGINIQPVNFGGGGIHCITQQEPVSNCVLKKIEFCNEI